MATEPDLIHQAAREPSPAGRAEGHDRVEVRADAYVSLNGGPPRASSTRRRPGRAAPRPVARRLDPARPRRSGARTLSSASPRSLQALRQGIRP